MVNKLWYNVPMQKGFEKKSENLGLKVTASLLELLGEISEKEDRPLGYVARELMIRGISLYEIDGKLRGVPGTTVTSTTVNVGTKKTSLAPVVANIGPGKADAQRMIDEADIAKPRKRKTG